MVKSKTMCVKGISIISECASPSKDNPNFYSTHFCPLHKNLFLSLNPTLKCRCYLLSSLDFFHLHCHAFTNIANVTQFRVSFRKCSRCHFQDLISCPIGWVLNIQVIFNKVLQLRHFFLRFSIF